VNDASGVRGGEAGGNFTADAQYVRQGEDRLARKTVCQASPSQQRHGQESYAVVLTDLVDLDDVVVAQLRNIRPPNETAQRRGGGRGRHLGKP
jgi:hypothetical protein